MSAIEAVPDLQVEETPIVMNDAQERVDETEGSSKLVPPANAGSSAEGPSSLYRFVFSWSGKSFEVEMHGDDR